MMSEMKEQKPNRTASGETYSISNRHPYMCPGYEVHYVHKWNEKGVLKIFFVHCAR